MTAPAAGTYSVSNISGQAFGINNLSFAVGETKTINYITSRMVAAQTAGYLSITPSVNNLPDTVTDSSGGAASLTFAAITAGGAYAQADLVALKNAVASIAAQLNKNAQAIANLQAQIQFIATNEMDNGIVN